MLGKAFKAGRAVVSLAVLAFMVLVGVGIFTALDSAATVTLGSSKAYGLGKETESAIRQAEVVLVGSTLAKLAIDEGETDGDRQNAPTDDSGIARSKASEEAVTLPASSGANTASTNTSQATEPEKTWHEPEYKTVTHEAVYETRHHEAIYTTATDYYTCCNDCTFMIQGSIYPHQDETGHGRYSTNVPISRQVLVKEAWDETVCTAKAWDEKVLVKAGYWA